MSDSAGSDPVCHVPALYHQYSIPKSDISDRTGILNCQVADSPQYQDLGWHVLDCPILDGYDFHIIAKLLTEGEIILNMPIHV